MKSKQLRESSGRCTTSTLKILFLGILLSLHAGVRAQSCAVQGIHTPGNIFHSHITSLLQLANPESSEDKITLVMINEQNTETIIYRYIFKIVTGNNKTHFVGILSQVSSESITNKTFAHSIIRYIQSADIRDAQRLLGIYDATKDDEIDCGDIKQNLLKYFQKNPIDVDESIIKGCGAGAGSGKQSNQLLLENLASSNKAKQNLLALNESQLNSINTSNSSNNKLSLSLLLKSLSKNELGGLNEATLQSLLQKNGGGDDSGAKSNDLLNAFDLNSGGGGGSQEAYPITSQPLVKTHYTLGSVLSGTGRDKIYQKNTKETFDVTNSFKQLGLAAPQKNSPGNGRYLQATNGAQSSHQAIENSHRLSIDKKAGSKPDKKCEGRKATTFPTPRSTIKPKNLHSGVTRANRQKHLPDHFNNK